MRRFGRRALWGGWGETFLWGLKRGVEDWGVRIFM